MLRAALFALLDRRKQPRRYRVRLELWIPGSSWVPVLDASVEDLIRAQRLLGEDPHVFSGTFRLVVTNA